MELAKTFEPHAIEAKWYPVWESRGYFKPSYAPGAPPFCIQIPPPNVTGTLHMGHAFQLTLMDVLVRWHRMRGDNTLWQVGTDHAGIGTQILVEQQLTKKLPPAKWTKASDTPPSASPAARKSAMRRCV